MVKMTVTVSKSILWEAEEAMRRRSITEEAMRSRTTHKKKAQVCEEESQQKERE